jgi:hypothetical protein
MSDTERPRCGCRRRFRLLRDLMRSRRGTYNLITVIECMVCGAAWEWGEVCAVKDKPLTKVQRLCRALGVAVPQRLPPKRES